MPLFPSSQRNDRGVNTQMWLGFISSFPLRLMFLCDILWSCCCLSGSHSCCRLRWAAAGGRGCVVGSWLIPLLFFGKLALVCVATTFEWRKAHLWLEKAFILPHEETTLGAHSKALQTAVLRNAPWRKWRLCPDLPPYAADSYLGVSIRLLFIAGC